jgi:hypothetical protein
MQNWGPYFKNPLLVGNWSRFPRNGAVGGPGGKFFGRRLARKDFKRIHVRKAARTTPAASIECAAMLAAFKRRM